MIQADPNQARRELEDILSQEEYQAYYREKNTLLQQWFDSFLEWLEEILKSLFPDVEVPDVNPEWVFDAIIIIGLLFFLFLVYKLFRSFIREKKSRSRSVGTREELSLSSQAHLESADSYFNQGDYVKAVRHVFLALLTHLDQKKWIVARSWKTNWEYYEELGRHQDEIADQFSRLAGRFDEAFYGGHHVTKEDYLSFYEKVQTLIELTLEQNEQHETSYQRRNPK
jgi:hypothetical protein